MGIKNGNNLKNSVKKKVKFPYVENKYNNNKEKGIPFVVAFQPLLKPLGSILNENYYLLQMNDEVKKLFSLCDPWFLSVEQGNSLAYLCRLNCSPWKERLVHVNAIRMGVRCVKAFLKQIPLHVVMMVLLIKNKFDCNKKCLVYLITCKKCLKQYIRQTVDTLRSCWNNYKDNARKYERGQHCMQKHLYKHFDLPGHSNFLEDVTVTFIVKKDLRDPTKRKNCWIYFLKTKASMGLNSRS